MSLSVLTHYFEELNWVKKRINQLKVDASEGIKVRTVEDW
jgi:hypothetical protein